MDNFQTTFTAHHFRCSARRRFRGLHQDSRSCCFFRRDGFLRACFRWTSGFHIFSLLRRNLLRNGLSPFVPLWQEFLIPLQLYFQTAKSEVDDEDNEDDEDDNDTDDNDNAVYTSSTYAPPAASNSPAYSAPSYKSYPKY